MGINRLKRAAVFLDRDGVINRNVFNAATQAWESPLSADQMEMIPGSTAAMQALSSHGFLLFVVSNQPNVAKAKLSRTTLDAIHERFLACLAADGINITAFYYCLHHPQGLVPELSGPCLCRKPSPYFLLQARDQFQLEMKQSWMIGDRPTDIECGIAAGVHTIRIVHELEGTRESSSCALAEFTVPSLAAASAIVLSHS